MSSSTSSTCWSIHGCALADVLATSAAVDVQLNPRQRYRLLRKLARHRSFRIGFVIIALMVVIALLAPIIAQYDPVAMRIRFRFRPPQLTFPFGTDQFGRDVFSRVIYGARLSLWIGLATALASGVFGAFLGVLSAQYRKFDALLMRCLLYTSPSPRDGLLSRMPSSA